MPAINFQARFADAVKSGLKRQTIRPVRRGRPIKIGDLLRLYTGQRTKDCRFLGSGRCDGVARITMDLAPKKKPVIFIGSRQLPMETFESMAKSDGFKNWREMREWFSDRYGGKFEGVVIRWTPNRKG